MTEENVDRELGAQVSRSGVRNFSGARLRRYRERNNLTIDDLADMAGVSNAAVSKWETGRANPTPPLLKKVAAAVGATVADLAPVSDDKLTLADLRVQAGLTQEGIAALLGVSATIVGQIEKGRKPFDLDRATQMATFYDIPLGRLQTIWERDRATRATRLRIQ